MWGEKYQCKQGEVELTQSEQPCEVKMKWTSEKSENSEKLKKFQFGYRWPVGIIFNQLKMTPKTLVNADTWNKN